MRTKRIKLYRFEELPLKAWKQAIQKFKKDHPQYNHLLNAEVAGIIHQMNWEYLQDGTIYNQ